MDVVTFGHQSRRGRHSNYRFAARIEPLESRTLLSAESPYLGVPFAIPATIQAEDFDNGGEGVAYHTPDTTNAGGVFRTGGVGIQATTDTGGGYNVGWVHAGDWLKYTITVSSAGNYDLGFRLASPYSGGTFHAAIDGVKDTASLTIPDTGGWQIWQTMTAANINLTAGQHVMTVQFDSAGGPYVANFNWVSVTPSAIQSPPPVQPPPPVNPGLPTITLTAPQPNANESGGPSGSFLVTRTGSTAATFTVLMNLGGTAVNGVDYHTVTPATWVTIPAGQAAVQVAVYPIDRSLTQGSKTVTVSLPYDGLYNIASPGSATVTITENDTSGPTPPPAAGPTPFLGAAASVPGTIEAENFDNGGEGVAYHSASATNLGGAYRSTGVSIEATGDTGGGYDVGWVAAGNWLLYTLNVATAGVYTLDARVADAQQGGTFGSFHVEFNGANLTGALTVPGTGNWQTYATVSAAGIALQAGTYQMKVVMDSAGSNGFVGNFNWFRLTPAASQPALNVLFFGNSFTFYNNLPSLVSQIAVAEGFAAPNIFVQAVANYTLTDQLNTIAAAGSANIISSSLPAGQSWNDVVIQEYSTRPSTVTAAPVDGDAAGFRADALTLFGLVRANSPAVHDVLEETWARGAANPFYPASYPNPAAMQNDLLTQYNGAASDAMAKYGPDAATVAYSGQAWQALNWAANLYNGPDEYHPSPLGSVLAALVVERSIYHERTSPIPAASVSALLTSTGLTATDWTQLTAAADSV